MIKFDGSKFIFNPYETKSIAGFDIESFNVSHDAIDPNFTFSIITIRNFTMITDTGYVRPNERYDSR